MRHRSQTNRAFLKRAVNVALIGVAGLLVAGATFVLTRSIIPEPPRPGPGFAFDDVTSAAGIDYTGGSFGAAWGDANGDGYPDLWASGHSPMRLLINQGDGTFRDRTTELVGQPRYSDRHNAAWADFDNDGDEDLLQLSGADRGFGEDPNSLFVNTGTGELRDEAKALGLDYGKARARAPVWLDADQDGMLDVIITAARRADAPPALFLQGGEGFVRSPLGFTEESEIAQLAMFGKTAQLQVVTGLPFQLLVHAIRAPASGADRFESIGSNLGLRQTPEGWITDALTGDFDNDLSPDLILVRGRVIGSVEQAGPRLVNARLQSYNGEPQTIRISGPEAITLQPYPRAKQWWGKGKVFIGKDAAPPADFPIQLTRGDPSHDGLGSGPKGLFAGFDADKAAWEIQLRDPEWSSANLVIEAASDIAEVRTEGFLQQTEGLTQLLYWNRGGHFGEPDSRVFGEQNCFAGAAGDFDNDGDLDLYLVCSGFLHNSENFLFENLGNRAFRAVERAGGAAGTDLGIGDSVAVADYDLDGFLDLFVRNGRELMPFGSGPDQLFRNSGNKNHWIQLELQGFESNRNGIGARITLSSGELRQMRLVDNGTHGYVQDFRRAHFGLGENTRVDLIEVEWPSGKRTAYHDLMADQVLVLSETGEVRQRF